MNIIEVKNNLVKLAYEEDVALSSFMKITDNENSYVAQVLHIESSRIGKTGIARLIFNYNNGIQAYDGSVPSVQADVETFDDELFLAQLDKTNPVLLGKLVKTESPVIVSGKIFEDKSVICAEKFSQSVCLLENIIKQNQKNNRQTVVFDLSGEIKGNKLTATKDFKLPLNSSTLDYVFDRGFEDASAENRAFIQDIFSELSDYIKTIEYIPFNDFNAVIDYEFKRTQLLQLIILKNRLLQFDKRGIFAQVQKDFKILDEKLKSDTTLVIDLSRLEDSLQTEYMSYVYSRMEIAQNPKIYSFVSLTNLNSNKQLLNDIFSVENVHTSVICPYSFKFIQELKQCSKNMFMFTPIKQQNDFGAYNIFVNKLAEDEFIVYGKTTKFVPLIVKLEEINDFSGIIKKDNFFEAAGNTTHIESLENQEGFIDLNIPEGVNGVNEEIQDSIQEEIPEVVNEEIDETQTSIGVNDVVSETFIDEVSTEEVIQEDIKVEESEKIDIADDDISDAVVSEIVDEEEVVIEDPTLDAFLGDDGVNESADIIQDPPPEVGVNGVNEVTQDSSQEVEDIVNDVINESINEGINLEEPQNHDDLTDEDLDMIESLSADSDEVELQQEPLEQEEQNVNNEPIEETEAEIIARSQKEQQEQLIQHNIKPQKRDEKLETKTSDTPSVPVFTADIPSEDLVYSDCLEQGDRVKHSEFGIGVIEKIINYGDRMLCSVNFEEVGRRLLDPKISEMHRI